MGQAGHGRHQSGDGRVHLDRRFHHGPVCRHIAGVSHPLFKPVRQPGGGHCAGRPIRQAGRAVLCFFSADHDVCHGLSQYGAPSAGSVYSDGIHDAEHLLELGVYLRQSGRARLGGARCGPGHPHRQKCGTGHRGGASAYDKILPGAARSGAAARPGYGQTICPLWRPGGVQRDLVGTWHLYVRHGDGSHGGLHRDIGRLYHCGQRGEDLHGVLLWHRRHRGHHHRPGDRCGAD